MKPLVFIVMIITLLVAVGVWQLNTPEPPLDVPQPPESERDTEPSTDKSTKVGDRVASEDDRSGLDQRRLFDPGYVNDPELVALAEKTGLPPACIIAVAKHHYYQLPIESGVCPGPYETAVRDSKGPVYPRFGQAHPYDQYSDSKLEAMAVFDPAAAMILARRVDNDQLSLRYYERALVLTGNPQPLVEWLHLRTSGENLAANETIDVEQAKIAYKIYLITAEFGLGEGVAEHFEERLLAAGVDIRATKREAEQITNRIREERRRLFPDANSTKES